MLSNFYSSMIRQLMSSSEAAEQVETVFAAGKS